MAVCTSIRNTKAWHTGQATFGALKKGVVYDCEIEMCQKMLSAEGKEFLKRLGKKVSFELSVVAIEDIGQDNVISDVLL